VLQRSLFNFLSTGVVLSAGLAFAPAPADARDSSCPPDSVEVGSWCVDKYEASAWQTDDPRTIRRIKEGDIRSERDLVGRSQQRGGRVNDYDAAGCPATGNGCTKVFAASIPGVLPAGDTTWFQSAAMCRNSGKELLPNAVWQAAALGTPDPGFNGDGVTTCNTNTGAPVPTGTTGNCVSDVGAFDMVGNLSERVADWLPASAGCVAPLFNTNDVDCIAGAGIPSPGHPAALIRGLNFTDTTSAGVFAIDALQGVDTHFPRVGFRCGRPGASQGR
jgi:hypothetical protein